MQTIPRNTAVLTTTEQTCGHSNGSKEQTALRTAEPVTNGFLTTSFLPKFATTDGMVLPVSKNTERDLLRSLSFLTDAYNLPIIDISNKVYPYNILLALWDADRQIKRLNDDAEIFISTNSKGRYCFVVQETVTIGNSLFFIPVLPLHRLLQDKRNRHCAELLLSVFAYLFHKAGVPYYTYHSSYYHYEYDRIKEWVLENAEEWEEGELETGMLAFNAAQHYGDIIGRKIYNPYQLEHFGDRLQRFQPKNSFELECRTIATKAFELLQQYPDRTVFDNMPDEDDNDNDYYDNDTVKPYQYISFVADSKGWLTEEVYHNINETFSNCGDIIEPTLYTVFDKPRKSMLNNLEFERTTLNMIADLYELLKQA